MNSDHNNSFLVDEILSLIITDCLDIRRISLSSIQKLIDILKLEYGVLFTHDGKTYYSETITRSIGSSTITTEVGDIEYGSYFEIDGTPEIVHKVNEITSNHHDLITAAHVCGYPIKQITASDYTELSEKYHNLLDSVCEQIHPYIEMFSVTELEGPSRFEQAERDEHNIRELQDRLGVFLNEE